MARPQAPDFPERREKIVERAADLFATKGFRGASMADLAAACGMSKSLFYHYFGSKQQLLHAVMASHIDQLAGDAEAVAASAAPPRQKLRTLLHRFLHHYAGAASRQKVVLAELGNLSAAQREEIVAAQRRIIDIVERFLIEIDPALARDHPSARARTMLLFGMINWTHNWYDPNGPVAPDALADMAFDLATGG